MNEYVVTIMRQGAWIPQVISTNHQSLLSFCQILESTNDVKHYTVVKIDLQTFKPTDRYLSNPDFPKWIKVAELS